MIAVVDDRRLALAATARGFDFDRIFRDEAGGVYRTLYAFTGGRSHIAEEATAEAFARAIAHAATIRDPLPWIYRTAFRVAAVELKRESRRDAVFEGGEEPMPDGIADLVRALRQLSPNQRAALVLRYEADLPVDEVARRMGTAAPTVRVHIHRGRKRLRDLLGAEEVEDR